MGNKCPCVSSGGRTKNSNDEYVVNEAASDKKNKKQEKNNKKTAAKYSVPSGGLDNTGFDETGGGRVGTEASGFTNLANIAPNGDGPKIYRNGSSESQEEIHIEYGTDTSERAVDVPGVKYVNKSPLADPNHNSKVNNSGNGGIYEEDDGEIIDTRLRLPSADLDLDDDNQAKVKQKGRTQQHINPAFEDTESVVSVEEKPDNTKDLTSKQQNSDTDSLSSKSSRSSNSAKVFDGTRNSEQGKEEKEFVNADDIDFDMDINVDSNNDLEIQHTKHKTFEANFDLALDNKPQIESTDHTTYEALMQLKQGGVNQDKLILEGVTDLDNNESSDFDVIENKKTISRSSSSASSSSSSHSEDVHIKSKTHETHFNLQDQKVNLDNETTTLQAERHEVIDNSNVHEGLVMTDMQLFEDKTDDEPVIVKLGKESYNSLLKENNSKEDESDEDKDKDDESDKGIIRRDDDDDLDSKGKPWFLQGVKGKEENLEIEEITLLIEKLEDSLVSDMTGQLDAEILSRNIVEKLDEISALREQAELEIPVDIVIQQMEDYDDSDEEDEEFEIEQDIIDWYNKRMDELNEAVGMDLLEMSIAESLSDDNIRPLFKQHSETQSYFIKKRIIELEKLKKKKLVTNQKDMFEPHPESPIELQRPTRMKFSELENDKDENDEELTVDDLNVLKTDELDTNDLNSGSYVSATEYRSDSTSDVQVIEQGAIVESKRPVEILTDDNSINMKEEPADIHLQQLQSDDINIVVSDENQAQIGIVVSENDSSHEAKLEDNENLNSEPNIFEETEISFGVNQFVSPSKSEEDLWRGVERLPSEEIVSNDEAMQQFNILEANNLVFSNTKENNAQQQNISVDNINVDGVTRIDKPVTKAKVFSMYDSDSDSSDQNSVSEDEIVANSEHRKQESDDHHILQITKSTTDNTSFINHDEIANTERSYDVSNTQNSITTTTVSSDNNDSLLAESPVLIQSDITETKLQDNMHGFEENNITDDTNNITDNMYNITDNMYNVTDNMYNVTDNMKHMQEELQQESKPTTEFEIEIEVNEDKPSKPSAMYGSSDSSSSDEESESEELIRKAFQMEKQQQSDSKNHGHDEHVGSVEESEIVAEKASKKNIYVDMEFMSDNDEKDSLPVHENNGAHISEQFDTDKIEYLERSQNQANDLLAEIQAISESKPQTESHSDIELVISDNEYVPDASDIAHTHSEDDFGAVVYNPHTEQNETQQEDIVDNMLLQLSMQPIPPLEIEDDNVIQAKTVKVASKETGEIYPEHSHDIESKSSDLLNNHPKLERKHTKEIVVDDSTDTDDTEGLIEAAMGQEKRRSHSSHDDSSSEEDPDTEDIIVKYDEAMKLKPAKPLYDDSDSDSSTLEDNSDEDENEGDFEAKVELRETLKDDIRSSLHQMTQDDFQNLMGMYRKERRSLKNMKDKERSRLNESLWDKLQRRKDNVDQYIHDGEAHQKSESFNNGTSVGTQVQPSSHTTGVGSSSASQSNKMVGNESDTSETSQEHEEDEIVEESLMESEELNQTIQLMDLEIVQNALECENNDELNALLQEHFELTEKMRKDKEATLAMHRDKAKQKLMERKNRQFSDSSSEDSCNEENTANKDDFIDKEMDNLKETYIDAVKSRGEINEQELHDIIVQYREDQQELIRKREYEKLRINEKLRERLNEKKEENYGAVLPDTEQKPMDDIKELSQLDADFYKNLYQRHATGELDEEEMGLLIEEHLDEVEEFKKKVQKEMGKRRKARKQMTESMKFKEAELMIDAEKVEAERIRNIRETEKQSVNAKLQERLNKKGKQYEDSPEIPPPKLPSKSKREARKQQQIQDYENVEYEC